MPRKLGALAHGAEAEPTPLAEPPTDVELAERLLRGDAWAREALYRKYVQAVWGLALRLTGNHSDAEDVVQDTFADAFRDVRQLQDRSAVKAWLMSVAVHQVHRRFRRRRLLRTLGIETHDVATLERLASSDVSSEVLIELQLLGRVLDTLPARERIAWMLRFVEGCSLPEVAQYCSCSLATAKRRIAAAQRRVERHVEIEAAHE
jgi:RNA polymerase sigma-70 factor (ECF subfamily)